jgi:hypothetical protein
MPGELRKISVNLPSSSLEELQDIARKNGVTVTETLRRAIGMLVFIEGVQQEGKSLLVRDPETKETERVIFR